MVEAVSSSPSVALPRIQRVVLLQGARLFADCTAEQMVRIAAIAGERRFGADEVIYRAGDPAESMYCVVEGEVELADRRARTRRAGPRGTFGVREILSDRLREEEARAVGDVVALAIDAEDFFDLLSNNVEIVKALFRQLLRETDEPASAAGGPGGAEGDGDRA